MKKRLEKEKPRRDGAISTIEIGHAHWATVAFKGGADNGYYRLILGCLEICWRIHGAPRSSNAQQHPKYQ